MHKFHLYMRTKGFLITLFLITVLPYLLIKIFEEPNDISNISHSLVAEFKKLTEPYSFRKILENDYKNDYLSLIDIEFKFEAKPDSCEYEKPFLLILVHSALNNFEKRRTIRETWGRKNDKTKLLFLLGTTNISAIAEKIKEESNTFSDLIIGSFEDSYRNLTYKHVMGFKYAVYHCKEATYILKTDDDIFVNIPYLLQYIKTQISQYGAEKLLMCNVWNGANVPRSYRSKYRFSFKEFPRKTFPTYCSGWFILYSPDVVQDLYAQAQVSEYFWVDDVFVTGILAEKLKIPHFNVRNAVISKRRMYEIAGGLCDVKKGSFLLGRPNVQTSLVRKLWTCGMLSFTEIQK